MPRYIRYLEKGEYKYASVKEVGDMSKIKTSAKGSLVDAINELIDTGIIAVVGGDINNLKSGLNDITDIVDGQTTTISNQEQLLQMLQQEQEDARIARQSVQEELEQAKIDLINKADIDYVDGQLVKKIDLAKHQEIYNQIKGDLLEKVSLEEYQEQYANIVEELSNKAESIDIQAIVDSVNQDITNQQIEVDNAKTSIVDLDTKVDTVKSDLTTTIETVQTGLTGLNNQVEEDISSLKLKTKDIEGSITTIDANVNDIELSISTTISDLSNVNGRLSNAETTIDQNTTAIKLKAEASEVYTKNETDTKLRDKVDTEVYNNKSSEIDLSIDGISTSVQDIERNIGTGEVGEIGTIKSDISLINQKADGIALEVETLEGTVSDQGSDISSHNTSIEALKGEILLKAESESVYTKIEADGKISNAVDTAKGEIKLTTDGIVQSVSDVDAKIDSKVETINSSITKVDQKADGIIQTVSNLSSTVDSQGNRLTNTETTIGQHEASINLKAEAEDVYTKLETDNKLGKKVDGTTYSNKMSEIDLDLDGITSTVSKQESKISGIDGTVSSHASKISTLDQRADGFDLSVKEINNDLEGVEGRIGSAETSISANTKAIELKASQGSVNDLDGKVTDLEGEIEVQAGQISQRVTKTEYDDSVGLNKWIVSKYDINLGSSTAIPTFYHLQGVTPSQTIEYMDVQKMQPFNDDYYIAHFFTNVYMDFSKTVQLNVTHDGSVAIYMNGAMISELPSTTVGTISLSLRAGWNTVEILHYEGTGIEYVSLGTKLSNQVTKLTAHIGVGNKNDTRLAQAETSIIQTTESIKLKADSEDVTSLGNIVESNTGSIEILDNAIKSKVESETFNGYSQRVKDAESSINQLEDEITQKVNVTDYDLLNDSVKEQETIIQQLNESIALKVGEDVVDGLNDIISEHGTEISLTKDEILLKANKTELDETTGRVTDAEALLSVQADAINQRVTKTEFDGVVDDLDGLTTNVETFQRQTADSISSLATKGSVYTKSEVDGKVKTVSDDLSSFQEQTAEGFSQTANKTEVYTKGQTDSKLGGKVDNSTYNGLVERVSDTESAIEQTAGKIESSVTKTEMSNAINDIEVGGRNLFRPNSTFKSRETSAVAKNSPTSSYVDSSWRQFAEQYPLDGEKEFTISLWVKSKSGASQIAVHPVQYTTLTGGTRSSSPSKYYTVTDEWKYLEYTLTSHPNTESAHLYLRTSAGEAWINAVKVEKGNKATDWTPAPEDIDERVSSAESRIAQTEKDIISTVSRKEFTGETVVSMINQTPDSIKISAGSIEMNGVVSFGSFTSDVQSMVNQGASAKSAIDSNKATWDRAGNFSSSGTLSTGKLSGTIGETQINSSARNKWNAKANPSDITNAVDAIEIGGRNYIPNSKDEVILTGFGKFYTLSSEKDELANQPAIISFEAKHAEGNPSIIPHVYYRTSGGSNLGFSYGESKGTTSEYQRFVIPIDKNKIPNDMTNYVTLAIRKNDSTNKLHIRKVMLEKGTKASDWSHSPEDVDTAISTAESNAESYARNRFDGTKNTVNNNESTWSRAGNINSDGSFSTSKLSGTVSDNQISSAGTWNTGANNASSVKGKIESSEFQTVGNNYYNSSSIPSSNGGKWHRIASNNGSRAHARFIIRDTTSSQHGIAVFEAGINYSKNPYINLTSYGLYSARSFTKARIVRKSTYDNVYLEVFINDNSRAQSLSYWITDNIQTSGWVGIDWTIGSIPTGYSTYEVDINENTVVNKVADTAKTTANAVDSTVTGNKPTWDRSSNINSNGSFNTSKLSGTVSDNQVSSSSKWNTGASNASSAKSTVDSNKSTWDRASNFSSSGALATSKLSGTVSDSQISSAGTWNAKPSKSYVDDKDYIKVPDTRNTNQLPSWYRSNYGSKVVSEFKNTSTVGLNVGSTYGTMTSYVGWSNTSGGRIRQVIEVAEGTYVRLSNSADSAWGAWRKSFDEQNKPRINGDTTGTLAESQINSGTQTKINNGNSAKSTVDSSKSTWDRAGNFSSSGTLTTSKLSGTVSESQINSTTTAKWNDAKSMVDSWRHTNKTYIDGANIYTGTIKAGHLSADAIDGRTIRGAFINGGTITGGTINGATFNASFTGVGSTPYGTAVLDNDSLGFYMSSDDGSMYGSYNSRMVFNKDGLDYHWEQGGIGSVSGSVAPHGLYYDGTLAGGNNYGLYEGYMDIGIDIGINSSSLNISNNYYTDNPTSANSGHINIKSVSDTYLINGDGWGRFGARNTSHFHMDTDRPDFYMYKPLNVDSVTVRGDNGVSTKTIFSKYNTSRQMLNDHDNGNVSLSAVGGSLYLGYYNTSQIYVNKDMEMRGKARVTSTGVNHGLQISDGAYDHIITSHTSYGDLIIYPQRYSGRNIFTIRSHHQRGTYRDDFWIENDGIFFSRGIYDNTSSNSSNARVSYSGSTDRGSVYRVVSAKKYKTEIETIDDVNPYNLLKLEPKSWFDKKEVSDNGGTTKGLSRSYGLVADELEEVGLSQYVDYINGEIEGLQYERLWTLLIPIVREQKEEIQKLYDKIEVLIKHIERR